MDGMRGNHRSSRYHQQTHTSYAQGYAPAPSHSSAPPPQVGASYAPQYHPPAPDYSSSYQAQHHSSSAASQPPPHVLQQQHQAISSVAQPNIYGASGKKYKELGMLQQGGYNKDVNNAMNGMAVPYMSSAERARHEVFVQNGRLHTYGQNGSLQPMDTTGAVNPMDRHLFVMDGKGGVYAGSSTDVMHHSAFMAGNPVAAAGTLKVTQGQLHEMSDTSGHYAPPRDYGQQFHKEMRRRDTDLSQANFNYQGMPKKDKKRLAKENGIEFERMYPHGVERKYY
ncbi:hypothetical protein [Cystobacter fuscus]|uniref:hypothetical protein n=1 Tax=Cystobacter fuscus TaxID=43 RepID=UPI002B2C5BAF|nr:hypothetical protein F0U63_22030 [Cystobacter fuscus]